MTPDLIAAQIKTDLQKIFFTPLLQNSKHIQKVAEAIVRFQPGYNHIDANKEEFYLNDEMRVYYQLNGQPAKNLGSLCVELGIFMIHKEKTFSLWVEIPRIFEPQKTLKYRLVVSAAEKRPSKAVKDMFTQIQRNADLFNKTKIISKFYPTQKFQNQACYFQKFYPEMDLTFQQELSKDLVKLSQLVLDLLVKIRILHKMELAHGDLRSENVLVKKAKDSGLLSCRLADLETIHPVFTKPLALGQISHLSPESALRTIRKESKVDSRTNDIWALGCILFYLYSDRVHFMTAILRKYFPSSSLDDKEDFYFTLLRCLEDPKRKKEFENYTNEVIERHIPSRLEPLIKRILCIDPSMRLDIERVLDEFSTIFSAELGHSTADILQAQSRPVPDEESKDEFYEEKASAEAFSKIHHPPFPKIEESAGPAGSTGFDALLDWLAKLTS
ncbi:MAG: hypothetical protein EB053_03795 [Chlamydiae bacterium]|nr:hypothetical protein [Chlamydiota bacterium]